MTLASSGFRLKWKGRTVEKHRVTADRVPWYVMWGVTSKRNSARYEKHQSFRVSFCKQKSSIRRFWHFSVAISHLHSFLSNAQGPEWSFRPQWFALKVRGSFSLFSLSAPLLRSPLCPIITRQFPLGTCLWDVKLAKCFLSLCAISDFSRWGDFTVRRASPFTPDCESLQNSNQTLELSEADPPLKSTRVLKHHHWF